MLGTDVNITRADGSSMPGYAVLPAGAKRGVVVIHEILGRQPEVDRVVERFAAAGYAAVEPDLFHGKRRLGCIVQAINSISRGEGPVLDEILVAQQWLCAQGQLDAGHVGVIGFCLGGGLALAVGRRFAAVSTNYGDLPPEEVLRGSPPVIGCYGGRDRIFARNHELMPARVRKVGGEAEAHLFPTVGHSFLTDGEHPWVAALTRPVFQIRYDREVAEQGWTKIMAFFDRTL